MSEPMIRMENVSKSYDGGKTFAIRDLNLSIDKGDFVALLGPSGCGKSTTLMMLCGLYRPTSGSIYFNGRFVNNVMPKDRNIGMVFQSYALYPNMSVYENIAFPLKQMKTLRKAEIQARVDEVAEIVKISELLHRMPAQLSGGQQQRVAMCRALVKKPDILLLDEPMSNLDARLKLEIRDEIKRLQADLGLTSIIVTHDQEEAMAISSQIAVIDDGTVQQYARPNDLYGMPSNLFVASFIGTPPMNFLDATIEKRNDVYLCSTICGTLRVPAHLLNEDELSGPDIVLGIRPHQFELCKEADNALTLTIDYVEHLGKELLLKSYVEDIGVRVLVPVSDAWVNVRQFCVRPKLDALLIFDKVTRRNATRCAVRSDLAD